MPPDLRDSVYRPRRDRDPCGTSQNIRSHHEEGEQKLIRANDLERMYIEENTRWLVSRHPSHGKAGYKTRTRLVSKSGIRFPFMNRGPRISLWPAGKFRSLGCFRSRNGFWITLINLHSNINKREKKQCHTSPVVYPEFSTIEFWPLHLGPPKMSTSARRRLMRDFKVSFKEHRATRMRSKGRDHLQLVQPS